MEIGSLVELATAVVAIKGEKSWDLLPGEMRKKVVEFKEEAGSFSSDIHRFVKANNSSLVSFVSFVGSRCLTHYLILAVRRRRMSLADALLQEYERRGFMVMGGDLERKLRKFCARRSPRNSWIEETNNNFMHMLRFYASVSWNGT